MNHYQAEKLSLDPTTYNSFGTNSELVFKNNYIKMIRIKIMYPKYYKHKLFTLHIIPDYKYLSRVTKSTNAICLRILIITYI